MLFRFFLFLSCFILFFSCTNSSENEKPPSTPRNLISEHDTFYAGNNLINLKDTTQTSFESFYKPLEGVSDMLTDTVELSNIKTDSADVIRMGDTLKIKINKTLTKKYFNNSNDGDNYAKYFYVRKLKNANFYLIFVSLTEAYTFLAVNIKSGKETYLCGAPFVSPDKTKIICGGFDLAAGFVFNGLQLYEVNQDSLKPLWYRELSKWGADELTWMDNTTVIAKKEFLDTAMNSHFSYIKISNCK